MSLRVRTPRRRRTLLSAADRVQPAGDVIRGMRGGRSSLVSAVEYVTLQEHDTDDGAGDRDDGERQPRRQARGGERQGDRDTEQDRSDREDQETDARQPDLLPDILGLDDRLGLELVDLCDSEVASVVENSRYQPIRFLVFEIAGIHTAYRRKPRAPHRAIAIW